MLTLIDVLLRLAGTIRAFARSAAWQTDEARIRRDAAAAQRRLDAQDRTGQGPPASPSTMS
jgi:hypothetical protein